MCRYCPPGSEADRSYYSSPLPSNRVQADSCESGERSSACKGSYHLRAMQSLQKGRRGPKFGDAASLWNFSASPGWTYEEKAILKLLLRAHGVGKWKQFTDSNLLPGKKITQMNGQTQRLVGQQSLAAFSGLCVDIDQIRKDNNERTDVKRKGGLIIWDGDNPTKEMRDLWRAAATDRYGLSQDQIQEATSLMEALMADQQALTKQAAARDAAATMKPLTGAPLEALTQAAKLQLAGKLHAKIMAFVEAIEAGADRLPKPEGDEPQYNSDDEDRPKSAAERAAMLEAAQWQTAPWGRAHAAAARSAAARGPAASSSGFCLALRTLPGDEASAPHSTAAASAPAAKPAAAAAALRLRPSVPSGGSASDSDSSRKRSRGGSWEASGGKGAKPARYSKQAGTAEKRRRAEPSRFARQASAPSPMQDQASEPSSTASDEAGSPGSTGQAPEAVQQTAPEAAVHQAAGLQGPQPAVEPVQVSAQLSVDADHPSAEADQAQAAERRSVLDTAQDELIQQRAEEATPAHPMPAVQPVKAAGRQRKNDSKPPKRSSAAQRKAEQQAKQEAEDDANPAINTLMEMGYPRPLARDALRAARGSVSAAVAWLIENTC